MRMYDFIGDVHGHASHLEALLRKMGYRMKSGSYRHPSRKAVLLGDLIDRGPQQVETVKIVRSMVDAGDALIVLGNHEYNACAYMIPDPHNPGEFLRPHTESNYRQHRTFLDQVGEGSRLHLEMLEWFKGIPLFLNEPGFRAVHACWHQEMIKTLEPFLNAQNALRSDCWVPASRKGTELYDAVETVLKGLEVTLPAGVSYLDADGNARTKTRTKWWLEDAETYHQALMVPKSIQDTIPHDPLPEFARLKYDRAAPLFCGHYWMSGRPTLLNKHMACLDYSIGKGDSRGSLCAYRWEGEKTLLEENLVSVGWDLEHNLGM